MNHICSIFAPNFCSDLRCDHSFEYWALQAYSSAQPEISDSTRLEPGTRVASDKLSYPAFGFGTDGGRSAFGGLSDLSYIFECADWLNVEISEIWQQKTFSRWKQYKQDELPFWTFISPPANLYGFGYRPSANNKTQTCPFHLISFESDRSGFWCKIRVQVGYTFYIRFSGRIVFVCSFWMVGTDEDFSSDSTGHVRESSKVMKVKISAAIEQFCSGRQTENLPMTTRQTDLHNSLSQIPGDWF